MNIYLLVLFIFSVSHASAFLLTRQDECGKVPPMCHQLISPKYTTMRLPNMLNHTRYEDVAADIKVWRPLLNSSKCNAGDQLKFFLCFTYAPVCVDKLISPCKSLCETVRDSCDPVMQQYNHSWPAFFNCDQRSKFHDDSSQLCINMKVLGVKNDCSCKGSYSRKSLKSFICKSDFVFSGWVTKQSKHGNQIEVKASRIFRQKPHLQNILNSRSLKLHLSNNKKRCQCKKLRVKKRPRGSGRYLIIGSKVGGKMRVEAMKDMKDRQAIARIVKQC